MTFVASLTNLGCYGGMILLEVLRLCKVMPSTWQSRGKNSENNLHNNRLYMINFAVIKSNLIVATWKRARVTINLTLGHDFVALVILGIQLLQMGFQQLDVPEF